MARFVFFPTMALVSPHRALRSLWPRITQLRAVRRHRSVAHNRPGSRAGGSRLDRHERGWEEAAALQPHISNLLGCNFASVSARAFEPRILCGNHIPRANGADDLQIGMGETAGVKLVMRGERREVP